MYRSIVGADQVVFPEHESGVRLAKNLLSSGYIDMISLSHDVSMIEIEVKEDWLGKNLIELNLRKRYGFNIVAIKKGEKVNVNINPEQVLDSETTLIVIANTTKLQKLNKTVLEGKMTYEEALGMIEEEFETIYNAPRCKVLKTGMTYNGANGFCVSVYGSDDGVIITDLGQTKEIFDEVTVEEWTALCEEHGFKFVHWRIVREFKGMQDVYDFIEFLDLVSTKYWDDLEDE